MIGQQLAALGEAAEAGAGLVVTAAMRPGGTGPAGPGLDDEQDAAAWRRIVEDVHGRGALIVARLGVPPTAPDGLAGAIRRAASAGFDAILLDPGIATEDHRRGERDASDAIERLPAAIAAARAVWRSDGWIAAAIHDEPARAAVIGRAAQAVRAGANLLWVSAPSDVAQGARLAAAPLADRLRNELEVATEIECGDALLPDLDAAIGAGRADLVVVGRLPDGAGRTA
jgi:hypothetical protein